MLSRIENLTYARDIAGYAGGGFIVTGEHGFDPVLFVGPQNLFIAIEGNAFAPLDFEGLHVEAQTLRHVDPEMTKLAEARCKDFIAWRQCIRERSFPCSGAGRRKNEGLPFGRLENFLEVNQEAHRKIRKLGRAVIFHRNEHRPLHPIGNVGGARYKEKITTCHGRTPYFQLRNNPQGARYWRMHNVDPNASF